MDIEKLKNERIFYHFFEICKIPHKSYFEEQLSDYIADFGKKLGLDVNQDEKNNVIIRKQASKGYEKCKPIILQAHIDMVCEKNNHVEHNFQTDPIDVKLDGDILSTENKTTLGADDGIGVAIIMAILEDDSLIHPPIHAIFTAAEEEDMSGALNINPKWLTTDRMINIDNSCENEIVAGSSGGKAVELKIPVQYEKIDKNYVFYTLEIKGLVGGHSGEDINKGRANANVLLGHLLDLIRKEIQFNLVEINGGNYRLAIPRSASAVIALDKLQVEKLEKIVKNYENELKIEYGVSEKNLTILYQEHYGLDNGISKKSTNAIVDVAILSPNGIFQMLAGMDIVESSCNMGELYIKDDYFYAITEIRGIYKSSIQRIYKKIEAISNMLNGCVKDFAPYPSWIYKEKSPLRDVAQKTYYELYNEKMNVLVLHAGLECGCFSEKIDDIDAISIGPNAWDLHSPKERLSVSSTLKIYKYLVELLKKIA